MSDGLTVPFALAAGLTGVASATSAIVITAGLAEVAAGSIAMGLGGYLAARTDAEHYANERAIEERETHRNPRKGSRRSGRRLPLLRHDGRGHPAGREGHSAATESGGSIS